MKVTMGRFYSMRIRSLAGLLAITCLLIPLPKGIRAAYAQSDRQLSLEVGQVHPVEQPAAPQAAPPQPEPCALHPEASPQGYNPAVGPFL